MKRRLRHLGSRIVAIVSFIPVVAAIAVSVGLDRMGLGGIRRRVVRRYGGYQPTVDSAGRVLPPWRVFPDDGRGSMRWRMGPGEDHWSDWENWYFRASAEQRRQYQADYPEPDLPELNWCGFYRSHDEYAREKRARS